DLVKNRLHVRERAGDCGQDLTGRSLLVERFAEVLVACLKLVEQAHVLDGNHGLVGERFYQCDLLSREPARFRPRHDDRADRLAVRQSRTGPTSVGELLTTRRISLVAVCCSSASFVSLKSRAFSIAITAWSAKALRSSTWASGIGPASVHATDMVPRGAPSRII